EGYKSFIYLHDANHQVADSLAITSNSYGSFTGKFTLPQNILNGQFTLYLKNGKGRQAISVEEYKRPLFYVEYEKIKEAYSVNDSILITAKATAYSGSVISNGKVSYRVVRQPRFPYPWLVRMWLPTVASMEIAHGEGFTNAEGRFPIRFKAIPDASIDKKFEPVFDYVVHIDVTDINGETRSASQNVSAGYKSLLMAVSLEDRIHKDSLNVISVRTQNMNAVFVPAAVNVSIFKLVPEERLIRKRYWQQPDQFLMKKAEFITLFPRDEYKDESNFVNWPVGEVLYSTTATTKEDGSFSMQAKDLRAGFYKIEFSTKDKNGQEVKDIRYVELVDPSDKLLARQEYLWAKADMTTIEPGQKTNIQLGSSAHPVFLIRQTDRPAKDYSGGQENEVHYEFITLNNEKKNIELSARDEDRGGYAVSFFFVKDNRFYQFSENIQVPWTNKELKIEYASFRDKMLPGSEEKWNVKITGHKGEKLAAEMLASMYDASLDQFKPHSWNKPAVWPIYGGMPAWNGIPNFSAANSIARWSRDDSYKTFDKQYEQLNFGIVNNPGDVAPFRGNKMKKLNSPVLSETVIVGYGVQRRDGVTGAATEALQDMKIQGAATEEAGAPLYIIDGVMSTTLGSIPPSDILSTRLLNGNEATALYGARGANGVVIITTKKGAAGAAEIIPRKNFNETAFFFPSLSTDTNGDITFSFTVPEALTQWKLQTLAHTKDLAFGLSSKSAITQKELMVQPNLPRFLREGDRIELNAKVVNLSSKEITGQAELQLLDAATNQPVDGWFQNMFPNQYFTIAAGSSEAVKFPVEIPFNYNKALLWRIIARAGNISDGEENMLPVLTNKMLVTETMSLPMTGNTPKNFSFTKLLNSKGSESLQHHAVTVEYTANPAWLVVQALPYLMEYPYECAEQTWNRYYANALATKMVQGMPRIKQIMERWKTADTAALRSNLQKNEELKSALLQETPWVLQAVSEAQQKQNIALLFDMVRMNKELRNNLESLKQMQTANGAFVWFKGGPDDRYITQYIVTGIGHLKKLGAITKDTEASILSILEKALPYLDQKIKEDYEGLIKVKGDLKKQQVGYMQIQYLYMRSFFPERPVPQSSLTAFNFYRQQARTFWMNTNKYSQGMTALALHRSGDTQTPTAILRSLKETSILNEELGMYWKENNFRLGWYWWQAPIETQSLLIETFSEISKDAATINALRTWLVKNKQTNNWRTTKATAEACYAFLLGGTDWLSAEPVVSVKLGALSVSNNDQPAEAGTGYFKKRIEAAGVNAEMGNITVAVKTASTSTGTAKDASPSWGAVYWQYFEDLDKISMASTPLQVTKKLFVEKNSDRGPVLTPVTEGAKLKVGDKMKVRIELRVDRDMEYVHMKDMRAAALEPTNVLSSYKWQGGLHYYESTKDMSTGFFFSHLNRGTYVFEYPLFVTHAGNFSNGITTVQCMYAPEFSAHSEGVRISVE
ncbi:MAG TPA: alpha-2-macroglobulin family protein, partial [Chitinophagaceae bacterium]|nr:alpha-2-macroglobulin family protein [Chitinophagaceae bacterium]